MDSVAEPDRDGTSFRDFPQSRNRQEAGDVPRPNTSPYPAAIRGKEAKEMQQFLDCADGLRLREILPHGRFFGAADIRIKSCCSDPRICRPGDVYVAIVNADGDGHDEVDKAVQRGAIAVVAERLVPTRVPCCVVPDSREAYGQICQRLAGQPDQSLRLVGITGTHGKTTTAMLVASILQAAQHPVGVTCSLGYTDGESTAMAESATPPPHELARWLTANGRQRVLARCRRGLQQRAWRLGTCPVCPWMPPC